MMQLLLNFELRVNVDLDAMHIAEDSDQAASLRFVLGNDVKRFVQAMNHITNVRVTLTEV